MPTKQYKVLTYKVKKQNFSVN